ncbi:hypothetical protein EJB05_08942, partial [Eragrostis curvula]
MYVVLQARIVHKGFMEELVEKENAERQKKFRKEQNKQLRKLGLPPLMLRRMLAERKAKRAKVAARKKPTRPLAAAAAATREKAPQEAAARKKAPPAAAAVGREKAPLAASARKKAPPAATAAPPEASYSTPADCATGHEEECETYGPNVPPPPNFAAAEASYPCHTPPPPATQDSQSPNHTAVPFEHRSPTPLVPYACSSSDSSPPRHWGYDDPPSPPPATQGSPALGAAESPAATHWGNDSPHSPPPATQASPASAADPVQMSDLGVDWSEIIIDPVPFGDGSKHDRTAVADEDRVYVGLGLQADDDWRAEMLKEKRAEAKANRWPAAPVPVIPPDLQKEMDDAAIPVNDNDPDEVVDVWDRENPDMTVGTYYPTMGDLRTALTQHSVVKEFDYIIKKSDRERFTVRCKAQGCPWRLHAKTQPNKSVRIQKNDHGHLCASTLRASRMATQSWVAEHVTSDLAKNPGATAMELKGLLKERYGITISYGTVWAGRKRAYLQLFGYFDCLWRFKAAVEAADPNTVVDIETELDGDRHRFKRGRKDLSVVKGSDDIATVIETRDMEEISRHVVKFKEMECTCREWQVAGLPCAHALAFITTLRQSNMQNYVDEYFTTRCNDICYEANIPAICDKMQWPQVEKGFYCHAPVLKAAARGRPQVNRFKSAEEKGGSSKAKATRNSKCTRCEDYGHRAGSPKCRFTTPKKRVRNRKSGVNMTTRPCPVFDDDECAEQAASQRKRRRRKQPIYVPSEEEVEGAAVRKKGRRKQPINVPSEEEVEGAAVRKKGRRKPVQVQVQEAQDGGYPADVQTPDSFANQGWMPWERAQCSEDCASKKLTPKRKRCHAEPESQGWMPWESVL